MSSTDLVKTKELWETRWALARKVPWSFVKWFVSTFDEHEFSEIGMEKPFPKKLLYRVIVRAWVDYDVIFIEKSRQIMMSWIMAALYLWMVMFYPAKRVFFQSKKDEDAQGIVDRSRHIYERLKAMGLPGLPEAKMVGDKVGTATKLEFPKQRGELIAIPQGPDQVRSWVWSGGLGDESEWQPRFGEAYTAVVPALSKGAKYVACSSVNGKGEVYRMLHGIDPYTDKPFEPHKLDSRTENPRRFIAPDDLDEEGKRRWIEKTLMDLTDEEFNAIPFHELLAEVPGMEYWQLADGGHSMSVHYSADPDKSPETKIGREWIAEEKARYRSERFNWDQEMEMKRNAYSGRKVVSNWDENTFVRKQEYDSDSPLRLTFDFGTHVCLCFFAQYCRIKGFNAYQLRILSELVLRNADTPTLITETISIIQMMYLRSWENGHIISYCDPNGGRQNETTSDKSLNTSIKILEVASDNRICPISSQFAVKESTELVETVFKKVLPNGEPAVFVDPSCKYLISCLEGGLHYPDEGKGVKGHYEKDGEYDHGGDGIRYLAANCFDEYALAGKSRQSGRKRMIAMRDRTTGRILGYRDGNRLDIERQNRRGVYVG